MVPVFRTPHHHFVTHLPLAREEWHRCGGNVIFLHLTILFFNADVQCAGDGVADILNAEWPGGNLGFVKYPAHLANGDFCTAVRHAGDIRRIAAQVGRQHLVIGADAAADIVKAVENIGIEIIFPSDSFAFKEGKARQA